MLAMQRGHVLSCFPFVFFGSLGRIRSAGSSNRDLPYSTEQSGDSSPTRSARWAVGRLAATGGNQVPVMGGMVAMLPYDGTQLRDMLCSQPCCLELACTLHCAT